MKKRLKSLITFILIIIFLSFTFVIYDFNDNDNKNISMPVTNSNVYSKTDINYAEMINYLKTEYNNNDIVGILEVIDTDNKIPIVQTSDNEYYLTHALNKKKNNEGSVFLDYRVDINSSKKLLIYGHSSNNIDTDFNFLQDFYDKDYFDNHRYLEIITDTTKNKYEIFSVYTETEDFSYMQTDFKDELEYFSHINTLKNNSIYKTDIELREDDEILIIQTCSMNSDYSKYQDKYLLIISRRVRE